MLKDEVCIYEWTGKRVHALNATAAQVWALCDGTRSVAQIAEALRGDFGIHAFDVVTLAVSQFTGAGLLDGEAPAEGLLPSRRMTLKRLGLIAAAVPIVSSIAAPSPLEAASPNFEFQRFNYTGSSQTFVVPAGVVLVSAFVYGASGGSSSTNTPGGLACVVYAGTLPVIPGETLIVTVGGAGQAAFSTAGGALGGFNGGGNSASGGGGGGATDFRRGSTKLVVAGGGGGAGTNAAGGRGGDPNGVAGADDPSGGGGSGATQAAGGAGGAAGPGGNSGTPGVSGNGGNGSGPYGGGGGGGGVFGGGGGGGALSGACGAGGGGSSYLTPSSSGGYLPGFAPGDGVVDMSWVSRT